MRSASRPPLRALAALVTVAVLGLSACEYDGVTSVPLPYRAGGGDDAITVTVDLTEASGLTPNSEVKVDDVTVGSVSDLDIDGWTPVATVRLDGDVELPENAVARVGQKSLLGAKYLELAAPADAAPRGRLGDGDTVRTATAGNYPQTEQVLASLSLVLNGGGLQQVRTITDELDRVVDGREGEARAFVKRFRVFITSLSAQRQDIVRVVERLDSLSRTLGGDDTLGTALDTLPEAFTALEQNRSQLTRTLTALSDFGRTARGVVRASGDDLVANLEDLRPALDRLAASGTDLTNSLSILPTYPFPGNTSFPKMFQGDYGNLFITLDASPELLQRNLLHGFELPAAGGTLLQGPPLGAGDGPPVAGAPLPVVPDVLDSVGGLLGGLLGGRGSGATSSTPSGTPTGTPGGGLGGLLPGLLGRTQGGAG